MKFFLPVLFLSLISCDLFDSFKDSGEVGSGTGGALSGLNELCEWASTAQRFHCSNGKIYTYGSARCSSQIYPNIFCEESVSSTPFLCYQDQSPGTQKCLNEMRQKPAPGQPSAGGACRWVPDPPKTVVCEGVSYIHGSLSCGPIFHPIVFCQASFANNFQACINDDSFSTIQCMLEQGISINGFSL